MLKSCQYCGRIHDERYPCKARDEAKERRMKAYYHTQKARDTKEVRFRNQRKWKEKRDVIYHRDRCLCLCCLEELPGTEIKHQTEGLSVHHIIPIAEDYDKRLDEDNLITVCTIHHKMCEMGSISREVQRKLVKRSQEGKM